MAGAKRIPHCRLMLVADIKTGMMVSAVPVSQGLSGQSPRRFYDVVRIWPGFDPGTVWIRRIMGYRKTEDTLHSKADRLLVRINNRATRRKQEQQP